ADAGSLQSLCWASYAVGQVGAAYFSGALVDSLGPRPVFALTALLPLLVVLAGLQVQEQRGPGVLQLLRALWRADSGGACDGSAAAAHGGGAVQAGAADGKGRCRRQRRTRAAAVPSSPRQLLQLLPLGGAERGLGGGGARAGRGGAEEEEAEAAERVPLTAAARGGGGGARLSSGSSSGSDEEDDGVGAEGNAPPLVSPGPGTPGPAGHGAYDKLPYGSGGNVRRGRGARLAAAARSAASSARVSATLLWGTLRRREVAGPVAFLFCSSATPAADDAMFYWMTGPLGFTPTFLGQVQLAVAVAALL
ncbi:Folate-biopterin transporter 1, chloroplastic, partial [Tetrabaena socialis]